jgi:ATP-dependent RNA helicase DDX54/DBP10
MSRKRRAAPIVGDLDIEASRSPSISDGETSTSDRSFDISSALTQRRARRRVTLQNSKANDDGTDDDTELGEMIRNSISKRNVKDGTELLKNAKGKKKLAKGELGGGSFQSMGDTFCRCM